MQTQGFSLFDVVFAVIVGERVGHQRFNQVAVCAGLQHTGEACKQSSCKETTAKGR